MARLWNIAVVGPEGTVGEQIIQCLEERSFPVGIVRYLAGGERAGQVLEFAGKAVMVEELKHEAFTGIDIAFFAAGDEAARQFCPSASQAGAICIDTSAAWRQDPQVPLVVPEVNPQALAGYTARGIVANPDCSTIQLAVALKPLHDQATVQRLVVSTYQAVSDAGQPAIDELHDQIKSMLQGLSAEADVFPHRIAFNCLPQIDIFGANGSTGAEISLADGIRRVLGADIRTSATMVRVPVFYGNSASVNVETAAKISAATAMELIGRASGCELVDDVLHHGYPMPIDTAGQDLVHVGRIREDDSTENGLNLWVVADNIRKGAATNAVQIAELLIEQHLK